jgi:hypothetical protein
MSDKLTWHKPNLFLLDARATAGPDIDSSHVDPNNNGDVPSWETNHTGGAGETTQGTFGGVGVKHRRFDNPNSPD